MLRLKPNPTFKSPVKIPVPGGEPISIEVEFKHMPKDEYIAFMAKERDPSTARKDEDALIDIMTGWSGVEAEFSYDSLKELCRQYHGAAEAIVATFINQLTQAKVGN